MTFDVKVETTSVSNQIHITKNYILPMQRFKLITVWGIFALAGFWANQAIAHDPSQTSSILKIEKGQLVIRLELPKSFSRAVMLSSNQTRLRKKDFYEYAVNYLKNHLRVTQHGKVIHHTKLEQAKGEHPHSAGLILYYPVSSLNGVKVENSLLFELDPKQRNYHRVMLKDGTSQMFLTNVPKKSFTIAASGNIKKEAPSLSNANTITLTTMALLIVLCLLIWKFYKPKPRASKD